MARLRLTAFNTNAVGGAPPWPWDNNAPASVPTPLNTSPVSSLLFCLLFLWLFPRSESICIPVCHHLSPFQDVLVRMGTCWPVPLSASMAQCLLPGRACATLAGGWGGKGGTQGLGWVLPMGG